MKYCRDKGGLLPILPASFSEAEDGCGAKTAVRLRFLLRLLHVLGAVVSGFCAIDKHPILYYQMYTPMSFSSLLL